jgi:shikimate dehydrogenase
MDRYAVVGNPVAHSLSPRIHQAFAAATGQALTYETLPAPLDGFATVVDRFFADGGMGLNVTVPFKAQAAAWADDLDEAAQAAGAVNTIVRQSDGFRGYNTDGPGLVRDLTGNCGLDLHGARVLLLGAGGAARGVARPLLLQGPARLVIANRTRSRAEELLAGLSASAPSRALEAVALDDLHGSFDLLINATSAGLSDAIPGIAPQFVTGAVCYDMVYAVAPGDTAFCRWAAAHGARRVIDGLGMLVEQAALAFELWRGVMPQSRPVLEHLRTISVID